LPLPSCTSCTEVRRIGSSANKRRELQGNSEPHTLNRKRTKKERTFRLSTDLFSLCACIGKGEPVDAVCVLRAVDVLAARLGVIKPGRGRRPRRPDCPHLAAFSGMIIPGRGRRSTPRLWVSSRYTPISVIPSQIPMLRIALRVRLRASPFAQDDTRGATPCGMFMVTVCL